MEKGFGRPTVAPRAGAWISSKRTSLTGCCELDVGSPCGAWIETKKPAVEALSREVAPMRGRGLKLLNLRLGPFMTKSISPRAGAWIETPIKQDLQSYFHGRSPCGGVD